MKNIHFIFILLLLQNSCTYESNLEFPKSVSIPIVNGFFSSDKNWNIHLSSSTPISGVYTPNNIEGAEVAILENESTLFELEDAGSGNYISHARPQGGGYYTLTANFPDGRILIASDTLPVLPYINSVLIHPGTEHLPDIQSSFFVDSVYRFDLALKDNDPANVNYYLIRLYRWEIKFTRIFLPPDSLQKMELDGYTSGLIEKLDKIAGIEFFDLSSLKREIGQYYFEKYKKDFLKYCEASIDTTNRLNELEPVNIYTKDPGFNGVSDDNYIVMGSDVYFITNEYSLTLFSPAFGYWNGGAGQSQGFEWINYYDINEIWLEVNTISYAGYQYYNTYIKQILSKKNPFSEPVNTYTNIENGLGIFSGKQSLLKKIHSNYSRL